MMAFCSLQTKRALHEAFWHGEGPSLILIRPGEDWEAYVRRLAGLVRQTGARVILRPVTFPASRQQCAAMRDLWHELTCESRKPPASRGNTEDQGRG